MIPFRLLQVSAIREMLAWLLIAIDVVVRSLNMFDLPVAFDIHFRGNLESREKSILETNKLVGKD